MGRVKWETAFDHAKNAQIQMILRIIRDFALHSYALKYSLNLFADSEGPDQGLRCRQTDLVDTTESARRHVFAWRDLDDDATTMSSKNFVYELWSIIVDLSR